MICHYRVCQWPLTGSFISYLLYHILFLLTINYSLKNDSSNKFNTIFGAFETGHNGGTGKIAPYVNTMQNPMIEGTTYTGTLTVIGFRIDSGNDMLSILLPVSTDNGSLWGMLIDKYKLLMSYKRSGTWGSKGLGIINP